MTTNQHTQPALIPSNIELAAQSMEFARSAHAASHAGKALMHMAYAQSRLTEAMRESVQEMRAAGASWTEIGLTLGITKQAAQQRYGR